MRKIKTQRCILRPFEIDDAMDVFALARDGDVANGAGWKPHHRLSDSIDVIQHTLSGGGEWAIELCESSKVIGAISLSTDDVGKTEEKMLSFLIARKYWNMGYGLEVASALLAYANSKLSMRTCVAYCAFDNIASQGLLQKLGFKYCGEELNGFEAYDGGKIKIKKYKMNEMNKTCI